MKKTALYTALFSFCLNTFAMGLGDITISSYLDEPFKAEIELIDVGHIPLSGIQASVASIDDFERMGLERVYALSLLTFQVEKNERGKPAIKIRSQERITEPFLPLLIDLVWSDGQIYRSYTVFLDPPNYQLKFAKRQLQHVMKQQQAKMDAEIERGVVNQPVYTEVEHGATSETGMRGSREFGPTHPGETVWQIAQRYKTEDISLQQMILAVVGTNPKMFTEGNLNGLKEGVKLQIPSSTTAKRVSLSLAKLEVLAHDKAWHTRTPIEHALLPPYIDAKVPITTEMPMQQKDGDVYASSLPELSFAPSERATPSLNRAASWLPPIHINTTGSKTTDDQVSQEALMLRELQSKLQLENKHLRDTLLKRELELKQLRSRMNLLLTRHSVLSEAHAIAEDEPSSIWKWILLLLGLGGGGGLLYWWLWNRPIYKNQIATPNPISPSISPDTSVPPTITPAFEEAPRVIIPEGVTSEKPNEMTVIETAAAEEAPPEATIEILPADAASETPEVIVDAQEATTQPEPEETNAPALTPNEEQSDLEYEPTPKLEVGPISAPSSVTEEKTAVENEGARPENDTMLEYVVEPIGISIESESPTEQAEKILEPTPSDDSSSEVINMPELAEADGLKFVPQPVEEEDLSAASNPEEQNALKSTAALDTLLDLAKTYIGMGDIEAAKQSLEEVKQFGNKPQQAEAKRLLKTLKEKKSE